METGKKHLMTNIKLRYIVICLLTVIMIIILCKICLPAGNIGFADCSSAGSCSVQDDWRLILVNSDHAIPKHYSVNLLELSNGQSVDERIYPELQQMFDDARAGGLSLTVREGYRTHQEQAEIMEQKINEYKDQGYSRSESMNKAAELVAIPGTSEHEIGLAVDINATGDTDPWELYAWLAENSWKYGFILRYPPDKEEITGITYEPWHYRYVGKQAAQEIYEKQCTLEEYLDG